MNFCSLKNKNKLTVLGLMSGTSLDGLDICLAEIHYKNRKLNSNIIKFESVCYSQSFKQYLGQLPKGNANFLCEANFRIAQEWTILIQQFFNMNEIDPKEIDLIGSHGQTVWHIDRQSTLQIGEPSVLSRAFEIPCIADFRVMDIAAGGSGAPLVPFVDYLWFKGLKNNSLMLNIGGIANFTIIPADSTSVDEIFALDTGPGNGLIDAAVQIATEGQMDFDKDGEIAAKGKIIPSLLNRLMTHPYIEKKPPKSTGKEVFGENYIKEIIRDENIRSEEEFQNLITTLTYFTAKTIYRGYSDNFAKNYPVHQVIVSGGGADNPVIIKHLKELFKETKFRQAEEFGINAAAKEAHAFAILAAMRVWEVPANVPNVTGAKEPVLLGKIIY